jgi:hypothetical protein
MKKLFAISLVLAITASAAFAVPIDDTGVSINGAAGYGVTVINGNDGKDSKLGVAGSNATGRIDAVYTSDDGSFGALARVQWESPSGRLFAWWKPLSLLKLTLGKDSDGQFGLGQIVGWSYHATAGSYSVGYNGSTASGYNAWAAGSFSDFGATLALTPIDGLAINLAIPYPKEEEATEAYNHIMGQLVYSIADVGDIGVTYKSGAGYRNWKKTAAGDYTIKLGHYEVPPPIGTVSGTVDPGAVYAQFYLTAIQNLQFNIGLKYTLGGKTEIGGTEITYTHPIYAGFGAIYDISDTIGLKARFVTSFAGSVKYGNDTKDIPFNLGFGLMPYFDLSILKLFLSVGIEYAAAIKDVDDSDVFAWYVNPYITKSVGGGTFYAGFQLYTDGKKMDDTWTKKDLTINWGVPIGLEVSF